MRMRYQLAGIVHILAISGLHISILGMGLYNLLKKAGLGIWPAGIFSLGVMLQYGIMTGGSVSTMRAVIMFLIAMGARITGLSRVTLPICNFFMLSFLFLFVSVSFPYYSQYRLRSFRCHPPADGRNTPYCMPRWEGS